MNIIKQIPKKYESDACIAAREENPRTSWFFPLLAGETEVAQGVVKDANGVLWVINDFWFQHSDISLKVKYNGKLINQKVYTKDDEFTGAKKVVEADFANKHNQIIEVVGFMISGADEDKCWGYVYGKDEKPKFDNINGADSVYKIRNIVDRKLQDSAFVFFPRYGSAAFRVQDAAGRVTRDAAQLLNGRCAAARALESCVRQSH